MGTSEIDAPKRILKKKPLSHKEKSFCKYFTQIAAYLALHLIQTSVLNRFRDMRRKNVL